MLLPSTEDPGIQIPLSACSEVVASCCHQPQGPSLPPMACPSPGQAVTALQCLFSGSWLTLLAHLMYASSEPTLIHYKPGDGSLEVRPLVQIMQLGRG